jgi:hypothetical protein
MTETASASLPALGICLEEYEYRSWTLSSGEHCPAGGPGRFLGHLVWRDGP